MTKLAHFTKTFRKEVTFQGGDIQYGGFLPKQPVTVNYEAEPDEDIWSVTDVNGQRHKVAGCDLKPHPLDRIDNEEFLSLMLSWSKTALVHPFVLIAIEEYAKQVAAAAPEACDSGLVSGAAWQDTAREVLAWFEARRESEKVPTPAG